MAQYSEKCIKRPPFLSAQAIKKFNRGAYSNFYGIYILYI